MLKEKGGPLFAGLVNESVVINRGVDKKLVVPSTVGAAVVSSTFVPRGGALSACAWLLSLSSGGRKAGRRAHRAKVEVMLVNPPPACFVFLVISPFYRSSTLLNVLNQYLFGLFGVFVRVGRSMHVQGMLLSTLWMV